MLGWLRQELHIGRVTVVVSAIIATLLFLYLVLHEDADLWNAFMKAAAAGIVAMVGLGIGERFWRNKKVQEAGVDASGGANVKFEDEIARAVAEVNEAVTQHVQTINKRLYDLEAVVFKNGDAPGETEDRTQDATQSGTQSPTQGGTQGDTQE